ncbi:MAG: cytochrome P450 family protein [Candidatus Sericytochromatia bacterium]
MKHPINLLSRDFQAHKISTYAWLREHAPVYKGKFSLLNVYFVSRYGDCVSLLKDSRFVRNRSHAIGGGRFPFPIPKVLNLLADNMILADEPQHRRLRNLVHQAFTPRALTHLQTRIDTLSLQWLDALEGRDQVDLIADYALPIPVTVIGEMVGIEPEDRAVFRQAVEAVTTGFSGLNLLRTLAWDLPAAVRLVRQLIARKRQAPGEDILSALIQAEDQGQSLSEDELVSMVFLLILAGYETTVHLISNSVVTLLSHPAEWERLQATPALLGSAIEEVLRFCGPVEGTKMHYAQTDVSLHGVTLPRGAAVMPLLAAANRDPAAFAEPERFDIGRTPNKHLGFGQGIHYCLGAPLARLETQTALGRLFERFPQLQLALPPERLRLQTLPLWHRYAALPVRLKG